MYTANNQEQPDNYKGEAIGLLFICILLGFVLMGKVKDEHHYRGLFEKSEIVIDSLRFEKMQLENQIQDHLDSTCKVLKTKNK